jgi:CDP-3, 6-dideoxy-D-glycero-L-glycero-4-hexulose-4-reductase
MVIGATGFIGNHFVKMASELGHLVAILSRKNVFQVENTQMFYREDTNLLQKVQQFKPDIVLDLATKFDLNPINLEGNELVSGTFAYHLEMSNRLRSIQAPWVYTSSYWQDLRNPDGTFISDYHFLKHSVEEYLSAMTPKGLTSVVLMDNYGPDDRRGKVVDFLFKAPPNGENINLSQGNQFLNLLHVDDVCLGLLAICIERSIESPQFSKVNLISEEFITLRDLVNEVEQLREVKLPISWGAKEYRAGEILTKPNLEKYSTNWKQKYTIREGLKTLIR